MKEDKELLERLDEVRSEEERESKPKDNSDLPISPYPLLLLRFGGGSCHLPQGL